MRVLRTDINEAGDDTDVFYVPTGGTTVWHRVLDGDTVVSDTDTGEPAPPVETFDTVSPEARAAEVIKAEIDVRLAPSSVNSIAEMKAAIREGLAAAVESLR